jgi:Glycosyltransferase family 87
MNHNCPWHYPPSFLLLVWPLALLPYPVALAVWLGLTLALLLWVVERIAPHADTL